MAAAKEMPQLQTLCGIPPEQTSMDFSRKKLDAVDVQLIAFDLSKNAAIKTLKCNPPPCACQIRKWPVDQRL